jgi:hypothetical protein
MGWPPSAVFPKRLDIPRHLGYVINMQVIRIRSNAWRDRRMQLPSGMFVYTLNSRKPA